MDRLWGEVAAVPRDRVVAIADGDEVEGFRVTHTPGHARHHVVYQDLDDGHAYVGDMAGVRIPPHELTIPPTPPPEIDVESWLQSLDAIEALNPPCLHLTHFGAAPDVADQIERVRAALRRNAELSEAGDRDAFLERLRVEIEAGLDAESAERMLQATPPDQLWAGLERYWRKRREL
jgi:glyoxylase-like metal-dependent hydrolase (beta-lactamase superfamily II)